MAKKITEDHFAANIVMTHDSVEPGSPFLRMLEDFQFTEYRYPGGSVTENATWENGGLENMFGEPMDKGDPNYVMTIREALAFCKESGASMNIVVPTKQFWVPETKTFKHGEFDRYLGELEKALSEFPTVRVSGLEIGNEYWGSADNKKYPALSAEDYGRVANAEIPKLAAFKDRMEETAKHWAHTGIGIQGGTAWRDTYLEESQDILEQISIQNRGEVTKAFNHHYPNITRNTMQWQADWSIDSIKIYQAADGFPDDMEMVISEYNIHGTMVNNAPKPYQYGNRQATGWVEELGRMVDDGVDRVHHWGLQYKWLTNKFYDKEEFPSEHEKWDGHLDAKIAVTPTGMVYDLAFQHIIGKDTMTDAAAQSGISVPDGFGITGFQDETQRVVFLSNTLGAQKTVNIEASMAGKHVAAYIMTPADDPSTTWDESTLTSSEDLLANSRSDMKIVSGDLTRVNVPDEAILVLVITQPSVPVDIYGSDQKTDPNTDATNDVIVGGAGDDILYGGIGDDEIRGEKGQDLLIGGSGNDTMRGGEDADVIVSNEGQDRIFVGADGGDLIMLDGDEGTVHVHLNGKDNTVMNSGSRNAQIFGANDTTNLGLSNRYKDDETFLKNVVVRGEDTVIRLPSGAQITLVGYAGTPEDVLRSVTAFEADSEEVLSGHLNGMREEQVDKVLAFRDEFKDDETGEPAFTWPKKGDLMPDDGWNPEPDAPIVDWPDLPSDPKDPDNTDDEDEDDDDRETPQDKDSGGGGGCFVATAAYGHRMEPDVVDLRHFRDVHLVKWRAGRAFIRFYWVVGPVMARHVRPQNLTGKGIRALLSPLVRGLRAAGLAGNR